MPTGYKLAPIIAVLSFAVAGCGGDSASPPSQIVSGQIASVGTDGAGVTKAQFERFLKAQLNGNGPLGGSAAGSIPLDPPAYSKCKAAIAANSAKGKGPKPTAAQIKASCEASYKQARDAVESQLITYQWLVAEGKAKGISLTPAQVNQALAQVMTASAAANGKRISPAAAKAQFMAKLRASGLTLADAKLPVEAQFIQQKLAAEQVGKATGKDLARKQIEFLNNLQAKWRAGTICLKGYIVDHCHNGPKLPALQPPK